MRLDSESSRNSWGSPAPGAGLRGKQAHLRQSVVVVFYFLYLWQCAKIFLRKGVDWRGDLAVHSDVGMEAPLDTVGFTQE